MRRTLLSGFVLAVLSMTVFVSVRAADPVRSKAKPSKIVAAAAPSFGNADSITAEELKVYLTGERREGSYGELAARLNTTAAALKMVVSRMRQRYGELLRAEITRTVSSPEEVEEELHALFAALSR